MGDKVVTSFSYLLAHNGYTPHVETQHFYRRSHATSEVVDNVEKQNTRNKTQETKHKKRFQRPLGVFTDIQITSLCLTAQDGTTSVGVLTSDRMIKSEVGAIVWYVPESFVRSWQRSWQVWPCSFIIIFRYRSRNILFSLCSIIQPIFIKQEAERIIGWNI